MKRLALTLALAALALAAAPIAWSQANWEGPSGVFMNPVAMTLGTGTAQASAHYLNLQPDASLTTFGVAYGAAENLEVGLTHINLTHGKGHDLVAAHAKYVVLPFKGEAPQVAVGGLVRVEDGGETTGDVYLAATKIFKLELPVIASLTVRGTNALGSGLFGKNDEWTAEFGGFLGIHPLPELIVGVEYYEQPTTAPWRDLAVRWIVDPATFVDAGIGHINGTFDNQIGAALTHQW
jgi:hypothetical protein